MRSLWSLILNLGSISGLLALLFNIIQSVKKSPCFKYHFHGSSTTIQDGKGELIREDGALVCVKRFWGVVSNLSQDPNSLKEIYVVVWGNKNRTSSRSFGTAPKITDRNTGNPIKLPRSFAAREALSIEVEYTILNWDKSHHKELLAPNPQVINGVVIGLPKYAYALAFEDISGNLFDQEGRLRNREEISLRWTLTNSLRGLEHGITRSYIRDIIKIYVSKMKFNTKKTLMIIGLSK